MQKSDPLKWRVDEKAVDLVSYCLFVRDNVNGNISKAQA